VFRLDRSKRAGPRLEWKVRIFVVGAALGAAGMYLDEGWLIGAAIAVLLGGMLLRHFLGDTPGSDEPEDAEGVDDRRPRGLS